MATSILSQTLETLLQPHPLT